jgi:hypothetical protein
VIVGGGVALVAALIVAAILLWPDGGGEEIDVNGELASGSDQLTESMRSFSEADLFVDLDAASATATDAAATYQDRIDALTDLGDEELLAAATGVLTAERTFLQSLGRTFEGYQARDFRVWPERSEVLERRVDQLEAKQAELAALENADITATADVGAAHELLTDLGRLIDGKVEEYEAWVEERDAAAGSVFSALAAVNAYANPMRDLLGRYSGLRSDLDNWTDQLDLRVVYLSEALLVVGEAASDRRDVGNQMRALNPPQALAAAHASLVGVLDEAASAMESAYEGLNIYVYDPFWAYTDVRQTPGWSTFVIASDRISGSYETAVNSWNTAYDQEVNRIRTTMIPERPEL